VKRKRDAVFRGETSARDVSKRFSVTALQCFFLLAFPPLASMNFQ
jgi:hypothetical protein